MSSYNPTPWVDEDGSGNGTVVTAARMNNIEQGVADAARQRLFEQPDAPVPDPEVGAVWIDTDAPDSPAADDGGTAFAFFNG